jgi:excinuclease ABC subunit C
MASVLDSIPGIGPVKRKALLKHFGSVDGIRQASVVELTAVPGINQSLAEGIKAQLE